MTRAEEFEKTFYYFSKKEKKEYAKFLLGCKESITHVIGILTIVSTGNLHNVVNTESLHINFFDSEKEALNHCLDCFAGTKVEQKQLF